MKMKDCLLVNAGYAGKLFLFLFVYFILAVPSGAKVYIDITSPAFKKLPVAIFDLQGEDGEEISGIIREDLDFTGLFDCVDRASYIESASEPFNPKNWTPLGIEAVVKGTVQGGKDLRVTITLFDPFEAREILKKQYKAEKGLIRAMSHSIANDIYAALLKKPGIFRTRIAFVAEREGAKGIYIMDWDGHGIKKFGLKGTLVLTPHWSPDGTKIIYSSERGRHWSIYMLDFISMTEKKVFSSRGVNMAGDFFPDGDSFSFSSTREGTSDLYVFAIDKKRLKRLTSSYGIEVTPAVSPDGKHIAFVSDRGGSPQIYIMRPNGRDIRRVTFEGNYNTSPSWASGGDMLVFSGRSNGGNQIFTVKPDGSNLQQLTNEGNNEEPSFSPDGRYITFSSDRDGEKGVYIMRANGESQEKITPEGLRAFGPRWSPN